MNTTQLELLFTSLFLICLGVFWLGKKKNVIVLKEIGKRGSIVTFILIVVNVFIRKDIFN
ncbi:Uncharacterised protein [uncultured archaeon]|nr:Uncharacterised protein [uncultured archaeon]